MPVAKKIPAQIDSPKQPRFVKAYRPHKRGEDGFLLPTALEIEEGRLHERFYACPNKTTEDAWTQVHLRLWREEGAPSVVRCANCHTLVYGRPHTAPCGHCGAKGRL